MTKKKLMAILEKSYKFVPKNSVFATLIFGAVFLVLYKYLF